MSPIHINDDPEWERMERLLLLACSLHNNNNLIKKYCETWQTVLFHCTSLWCRPLDIDVWAVKAGFNNTFEHSEEVEGIFTTVTALLRHTPVVWGLLSLGCFQHSASKICILSFLIHSNCKRDFLVCLVIISDDAALTSLWTGVVLQSSLVKSLWLCWCRWFVVWFYLLQLWLKTSITRRGHVFICRGRKSS